MLSGEHYWRHNNQSTIDFDPVYSLWRHPPSCILGLFSCTTYNLELVPWHCVVDTHCSSGTGEMQRVLPHCAENEYMRQAATFSCSENKLLSQKPNL